MVNVKKLELPIHQDVLVNSMRTEHIIESLKYYVDIGQIKKQEPARKYFVGVGQLFEYVLSDYSYTNSGLKEELGNPSTRPNSYSRKTNEFVESCIRLSPKETKPPLEPNEVEKLINWCDEQFEKDFLKEKSATVYKRMQASLCIKLMILTGITYRTARFLSIDDLDIHKSTISICGFVIRLPKQLSCQFRKFHDIRKLNSPYLFNNLDGTQWGDSTSESGIPGFLETAISKTTIMSISKYGIIQLINSGINDSVIMSLTGASREVMNDCINNSNLDLNLKERYINSKIVNTEKYYDL
jgi:hypothetical protein